MPRVRTVLRRRDKFRASTEVNLHSELIGKPAALRGGASWEQIAEVLASSGLRVGLLHTEGIAERLVADATAAARDLAGGRPLH